MCPEKCKQGESVNEVRNFPATILGACFCLFPYVEMHVLPANGSQYSLL